MSLPPIVLSDLDPAGAIDRNNDLLLVRQGLNDKKATVDQIAALNISSYSTLPSEILASDRIIVGRNTGPGVYTNYIAEPQRLGFLKGVVMWFYCDTLQAPLYWLSDASFADRVLAVKGGSQAYTNFGLKGDWQQKDATLTISQIPSHTHKITTYKTVSSGNGEANKVSASTNNTNYTAVTQSTGGGLGHNHGTIWRPAAAVGIVARKTG